MRSGVDYGNIRLVKVKNEQVEAITKSEHKRIGVRISKGDYWGFASSSKLKKI